VISQAAVTRLASLKRGPINADSLGENLVFRKSADVKKVSNGSFQKKNVRYFATTRVSWLLSGVRWRKNCPEFVQKSFFSANLQGAGNGNRTRTETASTSDKRIYEAIIRF
jgi:hypothetical protein